MRRAQFGRMVAGLSLAACLGAAGPAAAIEWGNLFGGDDKEKAPPANTQTEDVGCPDVQILDGTAGHRVPAGSSGAAVRYQFSIRNVARECAVVGGQLQIKVGVEGGVMLGPAGSPGSYSTPIRFVIVDEHTQKPVTSKAYTASAAIPANAAQTSFTLVSEPLVAPLRADAETAYTVKVGFDSRGGSGGERKARKGKKRAKAAEE